LSLALQAIYPEHSWQAYRPLRFGHTTDQRGSKIQLLMYDTVRTFFPNYDVLSNFKLPFEDKRIEPERGLQSYEFDVSL
jgi:hypothetical protein